MMRSYCAYYQILFSLTSVTTVVSLATTSDGLNSNGGDVIQSLMNFPDSQSQWDDIALLGFDYSKGAIKGWGEDDADNNKNNNNKNAWTEEPLVAEESNYHGCTSRTNKRRRGKNTDYCPPTDAPPLHFRPRPSSSQQDGQTQTGSSSGKKPSKGSTTEPEPEPKRSQQQTNPNPQTHADGENLLAPSSSSSSTSASEGENTCPPRYRIPICATSKLERDPTQQGGWRREPWDESAASDVLFQQDFCRICSLNFQFKPFPHLSPPVTSNFHFTLVQNVICIFVFW